MESMESSNTQVAIQSARQLLQVGTLGSFYNALAHLKHCTGVPLAAVGLVDEEAMSQTQVRISAFRSCMEMPCIDKP
jgi:hypothetical protein